MKNFVSNTAASGANQFFFASIPGEKHTCRVFYRIQAAGTYEYSLLFTNSLDSTYALGDVGKANLPCLPWVIHSLEAAPCDGVTDEELPFVTLAQNVTVTDTYQTPPVELSPQHYLCLQMTFSGELLPYHEETLLPILERTSEGWIPTKKCLCRGSWEYAAK